MLKCQQFNIDEQEKGILGLSEPENADFFYIFILMSI